MLGLDEKNIVYAMVTVMAVGQIANVGDHIRVDVVQ
jgi:hypothetical protein